MSEEHTNGSRNSGTTSIHRQMATGDALIQAEYPIVVRPLGTDDLRAALAIQSCAYPPFLRESEEAFASRLAMAASYCVAATRDGVLLGYLLAHGWVSQAPPPVGAILPEVADSDILFVHDLAVSDAGRGAGIGGLLIDRAFALAAVDGLARAELIAVEGAASYWRRLGFAEAQVSPALAAKVAHYGADARWMTRPLMRSAD